MIMSTEKKALYALTERQHATILAALRFYQEEGLDELPNDIATDCGTVKALDDAEIDALCEEINHSGLEFGQCVQILGEDDSDPYVAAALDHVRDGELEVDVPTIVSRGEDDGAYVMSWIWIENEEAGIETEQEEKEE
jgi:hypothetical protein